MEDLEKAVSRQGINWEDFKDNIRKGLLTQRVISQEVGSHITIGKEEIAKYYEDHKKDYIRPEQVALREIVVSTEGKKDSELPDLKKKAETALKRVKDGEEFTEIAKRFSDGSTAKQGGFLGVYKRGELSKELEDTVFQMKKNDLTDVMDTKQGYLVLQILEHYDEGEQSLSKVEGEITDKLYSERMEPKLRDYLKTLREQSYVVIKPGYQDMAGGGNSEIQEVSATPEATKGRKKAARNSCCLEEGRDGFRSMKTAPSPNCFPSKPSLVSSSFMKRKSATRAKAARIFASNSAIAVEPSKRVCGNSLRSSPKISSRRLCKGSGARRGLPQQAAARAGSGAPSKA